VKRRAFALLCVTMVMAGALSSAFTFSAKWIGSYSAFDWWSIRTADIKLYSYASNGNILNTGMLVNLAGWKEKIYDISPYVPWKSVTERYISSTYAQFSHTFTPLPSGASMYGVQLQFRDEWTLLEGRKYEFILLRNSIAFYDDQGTPVSTGTQVKSVSFGGLNATLEDIRIGKDGYDRAIRCVVEPTADVYVQTVSIIFKSTYNPSTPASKIVLDLGFSDCVSYSGELEDVVVNPTLDNIDKQVQEIQKSLNPDVDYSKLDQAIAEAGGIDGYLKDQQDDIMSSADRFKIKKPSGVLPATGDIPTFLWALVNGITNLQIPVSNVTTSYFNGVTIPGLIVISAGGSYLSVGGMLTICAAIYGVRVFLHLVGARTFTSKASDQEGDK
jgi:hypothetical protein